jgi:hypothetical protein
MAKFSKYTVDNIEVIRNLDPAVRELMYEFLIRIAMANIHIRITSGMRTAEEQNALFAKKKSHVDDHNSYHTWGLAIDIAPLIRIWPFNFYKTWYTDKAFRIITKIGEDLFIRHPHDHGSPDTEYTPWKNLGFIDQPHYQYDGDLEISQLKNNEIVQKPAFTPIERDKMTLRVERRLANRDIIPV